MTNLATLCEELKTKLRRPQTAVDTRWDSEYRMLCIIFWLRAALQAAWGDQQKYGSSLPHKSKTGRSIYVLSPERWSLLEQLVLVLGRLERVTRAVEGSNYVTLPYVYLHLYELYHWLGKEELFDVRSSIGDFNAEGGNHYHTTLQQTLSSLHPSLNASSFSTIPSLQAALLAPEVAKALVQTHSRANIHAANGLDRLLIILGLKVENEDLVVVEEGTGTGDEEERGGATVGSIGSAS